jgi:hypothetical protein
MLREEVVSVNRETARELEMELGSQAQQGLAGRLCPEVQHVLQARNFLPVGPSETVPVEPCPYCDDGGLRIIGYVQRNHMLNPVRQCDTCHTAEIGTQVIRGDLHLPTDGGPQA